jgi:hypothetical protein
MRPAEVPRTSRSRYATLDTARIVVTTIVMMAVVLSMLLCSQRCRFRTAERPRADSHGPISWFGSCRWSGCLSFSSEAERNKQPAPSLRQEIE